VASEVIDQIPRDGRTYLKVVEVFMKAEDAPAAARVCEANDNLERAGECYEQGGLFQQAARMYYKAKAYSRMGSAFEKAGDCTKAAEVFEGAHLYADAARCQEKLQNWLRAGELYFKARGYAHARAVLSKIPKSDLAYTKAHVLLQAVAKLQKGGAA
jgi:tetratricopeptide (TPR) repeat protein